MAEGKLTYQHANAEEKSEPAKKRRREAARVEHTRTVAEHFKPADVSSVKEVWAQFVVELARVLAQHCWTNLANQIQHRTPQMLHEKYGYFQT